MEEEMEEENCRRACRELDAAARVREAIVGKRP